MSYQIYIQNKKNNYKKLFYITTFLLLVFFTILLFTFFIPPSIDTFKKQHKIPTSIHNINHQQQVLSTNKNFIQKKNNYLHSLLNKFNDLQQQVLSYLIKNTSADNNQITTLFNLSFNQLSPSIIINNIAQIPSQKMKYFTLDGDNIQEPI